MAFTTTQSASLGAVTTVRAKGAWTLAVVFALTAGGLPIALFALAPSTRQPPPAVIILTSAVLCISVLRLAVMLALGAPRILTSVIWMFIYISGGVVPLAQANTGAYASYTIDSSFMPQAQAIILIFALGLEVGALIARYRHRGASTRRLHLGIVSDSKLTWLTAISSITTLYWIMKLGGPVAFFSSRWALGASVEAAGLRNGGSQVGSALLGTLGQVPVLIVWITWTIRLRRWHEHRIFNKYMIWTWLTLLNIIVNNPISNPRYWSLTVIIGFLFAMPGFKARQYRRAVALGILAAIVIFPYTDYFRTGADSRVQFESIGTKISNKDYDQSTMTANGVWWVSESGHTDGRQLLGSTFFWVPRLLWPAKPLDTGVLIGKAMNGPTPNLSSPIWLEFWVDFGIIGTAAGGMLIGYCARKIDNAFLHRRTHLTNEIVIEDLLFPLIAGYTFILMRGPLLQAMSRLSMMVAATLFLATYRTQPKRVANKPLPIFSESTPSD